MEKNKIYIFISLIILILSLIIGMINIFTKSKKNLSNPVMLSSKNKIFKEDETGAILIKIEGEIHSGKSTYSSTGADTVLAKLREIEERPEVKGIYIEINSPGGTVGASQEIYEELLHLRKTRKIVVSMKDLAASGGYYIAAAADYIYAEAGTITGSIGVIAMSPNIKGLLDKYSVKMKVYKEGKYKDILSMYKDSTEEEDQIIQSMLSDTYQRFIQDIAKGRNMKPELVAQLAEGKIYSGTSALQNKLVDGIGGRREAIEKLSQLCGYEGTIPIIEEDENNFEKFFMFLDSKFDHVINGKNMNSMNFLIKSNSPILIILPYSLKFE